MRAWRRRAEDAVEPELPLGVVRRGHERGPGADSADCCDAMLHVRMVPVLMAGAMVTDSAEIAPGACRHRPRAVRQISVSGRRARPPARPPERRRWRRDL